MTDDTIAVYADYVCPFCYLGLASLRAFLAGREDPPDLEPRPFDLRGNRRLPDRTVSDAVDDGKDEEYYADVRRDVARLAEQYGVEMAMDTARDVDSWDAQQATLWVRRTHDAGTFRAFHDAVFDALWEAGRDIEDPEVLADVATRVGVDPDGVRAAVTDEDLAAALEERFAAARELGIRGIPTFVYDGRTVRGAVPPEQLRQLVEGV